MKMADDAAIDLRQDALVGTIGRVVDRTQERVAIGTMEDMKQRLVNRFLIGFGSETILDRAAAKREASIPARGLSSVRQSWRRYSHGWDW